MLIGFCGGWIPRKGPYKLTIPKGSNIVPCMNLASANHPGSVENRSSRQRRFTIEPCIFLWLPADSGKRFFLMQVNNKKKKKKKNK